VQDCGLKGAKREDIWGYARDNSFTIVSKDSDLYQCGIFYGSPPKFILPRVGNCARQE